MTCTRLRSACCKANNVMLSPIVLGSISLKYWLNYLFCLEIWWIFFILGVVCAPKVSKHRCVLERLYTFCHGVSLTHSRYSNSLKYWLNYLFCLEIWWIFFILGVVCAPKVSTHRCVLERLYTFCHGVSLTHSRYSNSLKYWLNYLFCLEIWWIFLIYGNECACKVSMHRCVLDRLYTFCHGVSLTHSRYSNSLKYWLNYLFLLEIWWIFFILGVECACKVSMHRCVLERPYTLW